MDLIIHLFKDTHSCAGKDINWKICDLAKYDMYMVDELTLQQRIHYHSYCYFFFWIENYLSINQKMISKKKRTRCSWRKIQKTKLKSFPSPRNHIKEGNKQKNPALTQNTSQYKKPTERNKSTIRTLKPNVTSLHFIPRKHHLPPMNAGKATWGSLKTVVIGTQREAVNRILPHSA